MTLHHWQQLAKPHLATILDPHPGVVTKGFRPLAQDAVYRLSDMEEDEEDEEYKERGSGAVEKGAAERGKEEEDEEEEEGGITFHVRCSSTPEERKERKLSVSPLPVPPLSSSSPLPGTTPTPAATQLITEKSGPSSQPIPAVATPTVQSHSQNCTMASLSSTTTTTTTSSGKYSC